MTHEQRTTLGPIEAELIAWYGHLHGNARDRALFEFARSQDDEKAELVAALEKAKEAFRLTREYVGEELLPAVEGWEWFDACNAIDAVLAKARAGSEVK